MSCDRLLKEVIQEAINKRNIIAEKKRTRLAYNSLIRVELANVTAKYCAKLEEHKWATDY